MGTTTNRAIPYVEPGDHLNVYPAAMKANAEVVDTALGPDTGWLPFTITGAGWTQTLTAQARRVGPTVFVRGRLVNATFSGSGHTQIGTLPAGVPGPGYAQTVFPIAIFGTTAMIRSFILTNTGAFQVQSSVASANYFDLTGSYCCLN